MIRGMKTIVKRRVSRSLLEQNRSELAATGLFERERLTERLWDCRVDSSGVLEIGGVRTTDLAQQFGTPLHVVHVDRLRRNYEGFVGAFSGSKARVRLGTSYKTNPVPFVLGKLHEWGTLAEVISHFELWLALRLGVPGDRIIFNGPAKSAESLRTAVENEVELINLDSFGELDDLAAICASVRRRQKVGLRVTTGVGWSSQFGFAIEGGHAFRAMEAAAQAEHLEPVGLHLHLGTGLSSIETYVRGITEVLDFARRVNRELGLTIRVLDFGGGFGVPTTRGKDEWDDRMQHLGMPVRAAVPATTPPPSDYAEHIVPLVNSYLGEFGIDDGELIFEPGRAITASAQTLLLSALRVKNAGGATPVVILDGGKNLCTPLAWEFHEIHPASQMLVEDLLSQNLYGPLCHPHDIVALNKRLPLIAPGDLLAVMDAGAYFIASQTNFSNPRPGIVAVENGVATCVRMPEQFADIVRLDLDPETAPTGGRTEDINRRSLAI